MSGILPSILVTVAVPFRGGKEIQMSTSNRDILVNMVDEVQDEDAMAAHPFLFLLNLEPEKLEELEGDLQLMLAAVRDNISYQEDMREYNDVP